MNRFQTASKFVNRFHRLKEQDQELFARLANKLLSNCFLCGKREKDRNDYFAVLSMLDVLQSYFAMMDYELRYYERDEVIHLVNVLGYNQLKLKKHETIVLLTLRKLYFMKQKEISLQDEIVIQLSELHEELVRTGLFEKRMRKIELTEILMKFKRFSLLENHGKLEQDDTIIQLYPSMLYVISYQDIKELDARLSSYQKGEVEDEIVEEDSFD